MLFRATLSSGTDAGNDAAPYQVLLDSSDLLNQDQGTSLNSYTQTLAHLHQYAEERWNSAWLLPIQIRR